MLRKKMAESEQVAGLLCVRLVTNDGRKRSNRGGIIAATILNEADVQPKARHLRLKFFSFMQKRYGVVPLFAAHGDHAEIGVCGSRLRVYRDHLTERRLGSVQVAALQRCLPL